jgi:hypothetical protein
VRTLARTARSLDRFRRQSRIWSSIDLSGRFLSRRAAPYKPFGWQKRTTARSGGGGDGGMVFVSYGPSYLVTIRFAGKWESKEEEEEKEQEEREERKGGPDEMWRAFVMILPAEVWKL